MKRKRKTYNLFQLVSVICMMLALGWLTISLPFVYDSQQQLAKQNKTANSRSSLAGNEEENTSLFGNSTEEKASSSNNSFSEEYLHDHHVADCFFSIAQQYHDSGNAGTYIAFHGELLVPPPNIA